MRSAGIDIGSRAVKLVLVEGGQLVHQVAADTGVNPLAVCRRLLADCSFDRITCTGYGRHLFQEHWPDAAIITEIKAVALGTTTLHPGSRTILDIGGQDSKAIALDETGRVKKFVMNDRCAAGTGQFLELMATALAYTPDEFQAAARRAPRAQKLSSMCSVFAQSELVSLIARGANKEELALGVHESIASRIAALAGGVPVSPPVVFTGGCARNECLASLLTRAVRFPVRVPASPQTVAAYGCARFGLAAPE